MFDSFFFAINFNINKKKKNMVIKKYIISLIDLTINNKFKEIKNE